MTTDKRRIDACLKACKGISTQNLEDNVPVLELARRYNVVLRERDALREQQEINLSAPAVQQRLAAQWGYVPAGAQPAPSIPEAVMEVIAGLIYEVERNICPHEETHRGGQWEICDMCGAKWADDRGGKPEFKWPEVVERARAMLAAAPEAKP